MVMRVKSEWDASTVAHCARLGVELGADVIKVAYTGDPESFSRVTESCCVPVVIAGGPRMDSPREILQMAHDSITAGGAGLSMGRNIFQAEDPARLVRALHSVVHLDYSVDQALTLFEENAV